jgi:hypothetical protein
VILFHVGVGAIWAGIGFWAARRQHGWRQALQLAAALFVVFFLLSYVAALLPELGPECSEYTPQGAGSC